MAKKNLVDLIFETNISKLITIRQQNICAHRDSECNAGAGFVLNLTH